MWRGLSESGVSGVQGFSSALVGALCAECIVQSRRDGSGDLRTRDASGRPGWRRVFQCRVIPILVQLPEGSRLVATGGCESNPLAGSYEVNEHR